MTMTTLPITLCDNYFRVGTTGASAAGEAPTITVTPSNVTKNIGEQATFSVTATGTPTLHYTWKRNGAIIAGAPDSASYTTPPVVAGDDGSTYQALVTNAYGNTLSLTGTLTVTSSTSPPSITQHPNSYNLAAGDPVTFSVVASGAPTLTYQWYKAPDGTTAGAAISGATSSTYTIPSVVAGDAGYFYCTVTNSYGSVTSNRGQLQVGSGGSNVIISVPSPGTILFVAESSTVTLVNPAALSAEPGFAAYNQSPTNTLTTSYPIAPTAYPAGTNGTILQSLAAGFSSRTEGMKFYGFTNPGYTANPTLHVRVTNAVIKAGLAGAGQILIDVYYGTTFISNLKTYNSGTIASETFPQDLTTVLATTGSYTTPAAVIAALEVRITFQGRETTTGAQQNSITLNYKGFETLGA